MANPKTFSWVDPTQNIDGTPIQPDEVTGYQIGIRNVNAANSNVGTYTIFAVVAGNTSTSEAFSALGTTLPPGSYAAAVQTLSVTNGPSAWSTPEVTFNWVSTAAPNPPSGFSVA